MWKNPTMKTMEQYLGWMSLFFFSPNSSPHPISLNWSEHIPLETEAQG